MITSIATQHQRRTHAVTVPPSRAERDQAASPIRAALSVRDRRAKRQKQRLPGVNR